MFAAEAKSFQAEIITARNILPSLLLPPLETSQLPALITVQAGLGGAEAAIFCQELVRMYTRFAEKRGWQIEVMSRDEGGGVVKSSGGLRGSTMRLSGADPGEDVYGLVKWERGVHRVQRIPITEKEGRMHTSTATVVVRCSGFKAEYRFSRSIPKTRRNRCLTQRMSSRR